MKIVNLLSLVQANRKLDPVARLKYYIYYKVNIKADELDDLTAYVGELYSRNDNIEIYNHFILGYTIPQISKEFDLLRFGNNFTLNIEIKSKSTDERIKKQLIRNKYYLGFLGVKIHNYTYVSTENKLYTVDNNDDLAEVDFNELIIHLENQVVIKSPNVNELFNPSNYLVSPFNSTKEFIQGQYFLTHQQEVFKKEVIEILRTKESSFVSICGRAGTGKTLLTYDIAKHYIKDGTKVLIIHCGKTNDGQKLLILRHKWDIIPIKNLGRTDLTNYKLVIIDETQRIYPSQLDSIIDVLTKTKGTCIFSYDKQQCLSSWETKNDIPKIIEDKTNSKYFELTTKIRTNKEIASFIKALFDKSKMIVKVDRSNIELNYFGNHRDAQEFMKSLANDNWKIINYTESTVDVLPYDKLTMLNEDNAHDVIGQEYDNVIAVIDSYFYYNGNDLSTRNYKTKPYYHPTKMLFQIMTRTRRKLSVIVIDNDEIMDRCLTILETEAI